MTDLDISTRHLLELPRLPPCRLSDNKLGPEGAKALAPALAANASVTECNLCGNELKEEGWCAIFDALRDNPQSKITKWDLSSQGITPAIVKSLAAYVAVSASLTNLS